MTREEERELIEKAQAGCVASRNRLVEQFIPMMYKFAGKWAGFGTERQEEIVSELAMTFIETIPKFELSREVRLSTFAMRKLDWMAQYHGKHRGNVNERSRKRSERQFSQFVREGKKDEQVAQLEPSSAIGTPLEIIETSESGADEVLRLRAAVAALPATEQFIIQKRLEGVGFLEIGQLLNVSKARVQQIEDRAVASLKLQLLSADRKPETESRRAARLAAARRRRPNANG